MRVYETETAHRRSFSSTSNSALKRGLWTLVLSLALSSCGKHHEEQLSASDTALREKLVGTWTFGEEKPGIGLSGGVTTFLPEGTFTSRSTNRWDGGSRQFAYEGTWTVKEGVVIVRHTKSSQPKDVPVGSGGRLQIVRLDGREVAWRDLSLNVTKVWVMRRSEPQR
jgi:hypothetical protein